MKKHWLIPILSIPIISALGLNNYNADLAVHQNKTRKYEVYKQAIELCKYNINDNYSDDDAETCKLWALLAVELKKEELRKNRTYNKTEIKSELLNIVLNIYQQAYKSHPDNENFKRELDNIMLCLQANKN